MSSSTFDGSASFAAITIDRSRYPFGDDGSFEFRTRQATSTLMHIELSKRRGGEVRGLQFRLYKRHLQVVSSFNGGQYCINVLLYGAVIRCCYTVLLYGAVIRCCYTVLLYGAVIQ